MTQIISITDFIAALQQGPTVGAGLVNLGNTCFANSVLQCLTHTHPIADYMLTCEHSQKCKYASSQLSTSHSCWVIGALV